MANIAFYAPIKPPDHPIASGDRLIAQNLMAALQQAGHQPTLASRFIAYSKKPDLDILHERKADALAEAERVANHLTPNPPDLWITYHPYCKAPDWIGPFVSQSLSIPYITIEAAQTGQGFENGGDLWAKWRKEAQKAMKTADLHLAFKPQDASLLEKLIGQKDRIKMIPPFLADLPTPDTSNLPIPKQWNTKTPILLAVGMMRPGKKAQNYALLAQALEPLKTQDWNLVLVGDGPARDEIEHAFAPFGNRIYCTGSLPHETVLGLMQKADLFCWPGWKEPIGMVYLEAQTMGLPIAALNSMGVPLTVKHGKTGLLAGQDDAASLSKTISTLLKEAPLRQAMRQAGPAHIAAHHSMNAAARRLNELLAPLLAP